MQKTTIKSLLAVLLLALTTTGYQASARDYAPAVISLDKAIELATERSVSALIAENQMLSALWSYNSYKANMLPAISLTSTLPSYNQSYTSYQKEDGSYTFVQDNNLGLSSGLYITQNIPLTGGSVTLQSALYFTRQLGTQGDNKLMSTPIAITINQPIFGVNSLRWAKKIEPMRLEESKREYAQSKIDVVIYVTSLFFNALISKSQLDMASENMKNSEELYEIAKARRAIGDISQRDLSQLELQALQAKASMTDAESNFRAKMFQLRAYLAISQAEEISIITPSNTPDGKLDYGVVLGYAMENSTFAKNIIRRSLEADYQVATAKGNRRQINLYASFGYSGIGDNIAYSYRNTTTNKVLEMGISIPILDWGKNKANVKMAESNSSVVEAQIEQEKISFNQDIFLLVESYNNQKAQYDIAIMARAIAAKNYNTTYQMFISGESDILTLNDARESRDAAAQNCIEQMYLYWSYYYQIERVCLESMEALLEMSR